MTDHQPSTPAILAPPEVVDLVERFTSQRAAYRSGHYNETQLRRDFLDPLFEALGWDLTNRKNYSEKFREVIHERSVEVEGKAKAADYAFQSGGNTLFFLEAKKPAVNIEANPEPAFQIRRYAWSAKIPISILSDFEQLAVYDCRAKPVHGDAAHIGRVKLFSYAEYVSKWDELYRLFSYQAVHQGSLDQYAVALKGKRGTADVDDAFLVEMERWREELARNIALRNPALTTRQLNSAVQLTIDRIIFLRICEERGIEAEDALRDATDGKEVYSDLLALFRQADKKYNSGLFHFNAEKGQSSHPDTLTPTLKIDDKVLKDILANLYYPKSPYAFKYIPADILGQVYERFLGKVIRLTAGHQARVEEKPEVRKAGGVYYTPTYIVEYIVKNTVGELLKDKDPEALKHAPLRVLDPACGSGSFLLGAYQYLLDWYLDWYVQHDPARWGRGKNPPIFAIRDGSWQLTMEKKKEILTSHIYGVDIDAQAVEVTKLSLLLKVVENPGQLGLLTERILPDLGENIQCGNSLIGPDYYDGQQLGMFDSEEQYRVNAFDWKAAFPQVFRDGGFDAVIGNPPYIRIQTMKEWAPLEVEIYKKQYLSASAGNYDIYVVFIERALSLVNRQGKIGFILPHKFFQAQFGKSIRKILSERGALNQIVHFGAEQVFQNASTYTCLLFLGSTPQESFRYISVKSLINAINVIDSIANQTPHSDYKEALLPRPIADNGEWNFSAVNHDFVMAKLSNQKLTLGDITRKIFVGLQTSADKIYVLRVINRTDSTYLCFSQSLQKEIEVEEGFVKPFLMGKDVHRYEPVNAKNVVIFPYSLNNSKAELMSTDFIRKNFPKGWNYLQANKNELQEREKGKMRGAGFYAYIYPKNLTEFKYKKIMTPDIALGCQLTYDESGNFYHTTTIYSFAFKDENLGSQLFFLGLLNSQVFWYFLRSTGNTLRGGYFRFKTEYLKPFPIRAIDFTDPADVKRHDRMVSLVESMLALHKQSAAARLPDEKQRLQRQIHATDRQIDRLVYELYGLTDEEIKIVEGTPTQPSPF